MPSPIDGVWSYCNRSMLEHGAVFLSYMILYLQYATSIKFLHLPALVFYYLSITTTLKNPTPQSFSYIKNTTKDNNASNPPLNDPGRSMETGDIFQASSVHIKSKGSHSIHSHDFSVRTVVYGNCVTPSILLRMFL